MVGAKSERFDERQQTLFQDDESGREIEVDAETDIDVPAHTP